MPSSSSKGPVPVPEADEADEDETGEAVVSAVALAVVPLGLVALMAAPRALDFFLDDDFFGGMVIVFGIVVLIVSLFVVCELCRNNVKASIHVAWELRVARRREE
jgi:Flp pilus assembly protein TadB